MKKICCLLLILLSGCMYNPLEIAIGVAFLPIALPSLLLEKSALAIKDACTETDDVTEDPRAKNMIGKSYELQDDLFLFQNQGRSGYHLRKPGSSAEIPTSFEEYFSYPDDWQFKDKNAQVGKGKQHGQQKAKILGIVKKGTILTVKEITMRLDKFNVKVEIDIPEWKGLRVSIRNLGYTRDWIFKPYGAYLAELNLEKENTFEKSTIN